MLYWRGCIWLTITVLIMLASCGNNSGEGVPEPARAVYYWRTVWQLDSTERQFLRDHDVKKIYLRFFDVKPTADGTLMPNATLAFNDTFPAGVEIIPTVFITENCLRYDTDSLGVAIVRRVDKMCRTRHVTAVKELQIDCDWTERSLNVYYALLRDVKAALKPLGWTLSVTIRLHQLSMPPPPADYGVLMVYNTGDFTEYDNPNPILSERDVAPYVKHLAKYPLPLCAAYPDFGWDLLFSGKEFKAILYGEDLNDSTIYMNVDPTRHLVIQSRDQYQALGGQVIHLTVGDSVFTRLPAADEILSVHDRLAQLRPTINSQVILYSLDSKNINNYNKEHYEKVFSP